jgi:hypothetical protein
MIGSKDRSPADQSLLNNISRLLEPIGTGNSLLGLSRPKAVAFFREDPSDRSIKLAAADLIQGDEFAGPNVSDAGGYPRRSWQHHLQCGRATAQ